MTVYYCNDVVLGNLLTREPESPSVLIFELQAGLRAHQERDLAILLGARHFLEKIQRVLGVSIEELARVLFFKQFLADEQDEEEKTTTEEKENCSDGNERKSNGWFVCVETVTAVYGLGMTMLWREEYDPHDETFVVDHCRVEVHSLPPVNLLGEEQLPLGPCFNDEASDVML